MADEPKGDSYETVGEAKAASADPQDDHNAARQLEDRIRELVDGRVTTLEKLCAALESCVADHEARFDELAGPAGHRAPKEPN